ncbi:MAG TPA: MnhB domain-containing protein [bacterium]|nr:MnhB domain-containing protein [bacterium]HOL47539.1 MnhB domain-containing protein [bacterium]HPQ19109.1 MnhB domain-containing protein [bacterium]
MKQNNSGMTIIVKTIAKLVIYFISVFAFYITLTGHLTPGGGFAGGAIFAAGLTLLLLAFGKDILLKKFNYSKLNIADSLGALAFVIIGFCGFFFASAFLNNFFFKGKVFHIFSSGQILYLNIAIFVKVAACLFSILLLLSMFRILSENKTSKEKEK